MQHDHALLERLKADAELLTQINLRRQREGDSSIFGSVERQILRREFNEVLEAELDHINAEISASEQALRDGSIPATDAAVCHADWVIEKRLYEAEISRSSPERSARIEARTASGVYQGLIVGETPRYIVQQLPACSLIAHRKETLDRTPRSGENAIISCSNGHGTVPTHAILAGNRNLGRNETITQPKQIFLMPGAAALFVVQAALYLIFRHRHKRTIARPRRRPTEERCEGVIHEF